MFFANFVNARSDYHNFKLGKVTRGDGSSIKDLLYYTAGYRSGRMDVVERMATEAHFMTDISKIHDKFFKENFSHQRAAQEFCRNYQPKDIAQAHDFSTIQQKKTPLSIPISRNVSPTCSSSTRAHRRRILPMMRSKALSFYGSSLYAQVHSPRRVV